MLGLYRSYRVAGVVHLCRPAPVSPPYSAERHPMSLILSRRDLNFVLYEWLKVEQLTCIARYADHSRETFDAALDTCEKIATNLFAPHNKKNDQHEPHFDGATVTVIPE